MKPLTLLLMALFLGPSNGARNSSEGFVIEAIKENEEIIGIQEAAAVRPLPASKLIEGVQGAASWYGPGFYGRTTANGERFSKSTLKAAHSILPFGTRVRVTNLSDGRNVVVRINDRGPFKHYQVIDLAHGAASQLQMMQAREVPVRLEILAKGD